MFDQRPLSGRPYTVERTDRQGRPVFTLYIDKITPFRARVADGLASVLSLLFALDCAAAVLEQPHVGLEEIAWGAGCALAGWGILKVGMRMMFSSITRIRMSTERISVLRWHGWVHYARSIEHSVAVIPHDRTQHEMREHALAERRAGAKGRVIQKKLYYGRSFHVVLFHAGYRRDLVTIYGEKQTARVGQRIQYCDRRLNDAAQMGGGLPLSPSEEWTQSTGGLGDA